MNNRLETKTQSNCFDDPNLVFASVEVPLDDWSSLRAFLFADIQDFATEGFNDIATLHSLSWIDLPILIGGVIRLTCQNLHSISS